MSITKASLIDLNGQELILDADADTSITADTDDQIDIKIAGSDSIRIKANEIENVSGAFTLDVDGNITLDSDGGVIDFSDGGTNIGRIENSSSDFKLESRVQDKDILLIGNDGGVGVTALQLDMSAAGKAVFNAGIVVNESGGDNNTRFEGDSVTSLLEIDASTDRIGIATSAPDSLLELRTAVTNATGGLLLTNTNASGYSTVQFKNTGGTAQTYTLALGGSSSAFAQKLYIYDDTDAAARVVLDHDGKVGIGIDTPGGLPFQTKVSSGDNKFRQTTAAKDAFTLGLDNSTGDTIIGTHTNYPHTTFKDGGNVEIADGDLVIGTYGHGINFSNAVDGTSAQNISEILDDYEEGAFTPTFYNDIGGTNYNIQNGSYVKIGGLITFNIYIQMSSWTSSSSALAIAGLPFASGVSTSGQLNSYGGAYVSYVSNAEGSTEIRHGHIGSQGTTIALQNHTGGSSTAVTGSGHGNNFSIIVNGFYHNK